MKLTKEHIFVMIREALLFNRYPVVENISYEKAEDTNDESRHLDDALSTIEASITDFEDELELYKTYGGD
tara:strand:- start:44 stop:253 length:210 start_codon:yes stop_codon:yes gene_type:complete